MNNAQKFGLVIVAAGRGERAGSPENGPKQYRWIGGRPVIARTLSAFLSHPDCAEVVVVIHADDQALYAAATTGLSGMASVRTVFGGADRQASVRAGLQAMC